MADEERLSTMFPLSRVDVSVDEVGPVSSSVLSRSGTKPDGLLPRIVDSIPEPVVVLDEQYRVVATNRATRTLLATDQSPFLGYSISRFLSTERLSEAHTKLNLTGAVQVYRDILPSLETQRMLEVRLDRLIFHGQQYLCMTLRDRTNQDREQAEKEAGEDGSFQLSEPSPSETAFERLETAHHLEALGHLVGSCAHDFNNLLCVISASLETLERRILAGQDPTVDLKRAREATERSQQRASEILRYSRRHDEAAGSFSPALVLGEIRGLLERAVGPEAKISYHLESAQEVRSLTSQFETAVLNLAINARDALSSGGLIEISVEEVRVDVEAAREIGLAVGAHLVVEVRDNGRGMSNEVKEKAFDAFFSTKEPGRGTGLGLSSVRAFMRHWGGGVRLTSVLGEGTTVSLYFPIP